MITLRSMPAILLANLVLRGMTLRTGGARVGWGSWLKCRLSIGEGTGIGWRFQARGAGQLTIGRYCAFGEDITVITSNHDSERLSLSYLLQDQVVGKRFTAATKDVTIGHDVWIGDRVIILPGVTIGDGAIIGAGSVVTKSIPAFRIAAGNPARVLKPRFTPETEAWVQASQWWLRSIDDLKTDRARFEQRYPRPD